MIYFFKSHCNCIGNCVRKNLHVIYCLVFFIPSILTAILLIYTDDIFLSVFTDGVNDEKIWLVNITKYKILIEKIRQYFHLYLSIFLQWRLLFLANEFIENGNLSQHLRSNSGKNASA
jgi:hypothetical protein